MQLSEASDEVTPRQEALRTQHIQRLMRELQCKKQISTLRDRYGQVELTRAAIARCLRDPWDAISEPSRVGRDKLARYLKQYLPLDKLKACLPLLLKPADLTLVRTALDQEKEGPSPGLDGVSAKVYKTFQSFFVPLMHHTYTYPLGGVPLGQGWSRGVQINIPKGSFIDSITELRPLTIVNVMPKWISTIGLLQHEDVFLQLCQHNRPRS